LPAQLLHLRDPAGSVLFLFLEGGNLLGDLVPPRLAALGFD